MARIDDVAKRAGVSTATISRVLSGKGFVSDELRQRVLAAVTELNYSPDGIARSMAQGRTRTIGLVVTDMTNPFYTAVARGIEDAAQERDYAVVLCNTDENPEKEQKYLQVLRERRVDGILLATAAEDVTHIQRLMQAGVKIVLIAQAVASIDLPSVAVDNAGGAFQATKYLIRLGHTRIGMVTGTIGVATARERLDGYLTAFRESGISPDPSLIRSGGFTDEGGYLAGQYFWQLPHRPTAIISSNSVMTGGLLRALKERGSRVRDDVSVISFGDLPYFSLLEHPLTAVVQPMYELGKRATTMLLEIIENQAAPPPTANIRLPVQLLIRDSCRAPGDDSEEKKDP